MANRRKQFGYRTFGGIKYRFSRDFDTKSEARNFASVLRKRGKLARVTRGQTLVSRSPYYIVWTIGGK